MNLVLPDYFRTRNWARQLATNFVFLIAINFVIAVFLTYVMRYGHGFSENLTFAFCVGTLMWLFLDGGRLVLWGTDMPPLLPFFFLCLIAIPAARILGGMLAVDLFGMQDKNLQEFWAQNPLRFFVVTVLISALVIWIFWNRSKVACLIANAETEKARVAAIEKQAMQAQLQLLQAQIEPHMLFNTLANVQALITADAPRAQHMLDQLILYLRTTLSSSRAEKTTLGHEFSLMEAYLELMSIRMGPRLRYSLQLPASLREIHVPPMLLQPLIENAIKHGLEPNIEGGQISVVAQQEADRLNLSVADTGLGLPAPDAMAIPGNTSVGLENVRQRLSAMYGDRATLSLTPNTPSGVLAQLTIPLS